MGFKLIKNLTLIIFLIIIISYSNYNELETLTIENKFSIDVEDNLEKNNLEDSDDLKTNQELEKLSQITIIDIIYGYLFILLIILFSLFYKRINHQKT
ncbi:MAG: hypothetical protein CMB64_01295 [Euryarchaeota archaeon]|nr:hypothetical protein [Euryarchaeota archaeon]|tara:strand:- start:5183 stop:5476 length:294 start_codon:yes stop_codon:yes gene_type:complete